EKADAARKAGMTADGTAEAAATDPSGRHAPTARARAAAARSSATSNARAKTPESEGEPARADISTRAPRAANESAAASGRKPANAGAAATAERSEADRPPSRSEDPAIVALRNELTAMRSMLRRQLAQISAADRQLLDPERALL